jgi:hypothetical protein
MCRVLCRRRRPRHARTLELTLTIDVDVGVGRCACGRRQNTAHAIATVGIQMIVQLFTNQWSIPVHTLTDGEGTKTEAKEMMRIGKRMRM